MNTMQKFGLLTAALAWTLAGTIAQAQTEPKMKMTTDIPVDITTPSSVETRLGTLKFFDGFPDKETTRRFTTTWISSAV